MSLFCRRFLLSVLSLSLIALSITLGRQGRAAAPETFEVLADTPRKSVVAGFDFASLDRSANACQDFNRFANGGWMDKNPIPAAYSRWGRFELLDEQNQNVLHGILDGLLAKNKFANGDEQKIADFYGSCMEETKIEAEGIKPLEPELQRIAQITDLVSLEESRQYLALAPVRISRTRHRSSRR
jgi:putative endopeptidase